MFIYTIIVLALLILALIFINSIMNKIMDEMDSVIRDLTEESFDLTKLKINKEIK